MSISVVASQPKGAVQPTIPVAPTGFSLEQWQTFERDGILTIEDAISPTDVKRYLAAAQECLERYPNYSPQNTWKITRLIMEHPVFQDLIDHPRHIGYAYDIFGDHTRLGQADLFVRPKQGVINHWHVDGPRAVPYRTFSPILPLKLRIGYWLTDVPNDNMGNLVYLPGSHAADYELEHKGTGPLEGEKVLRCKAGTITIAHASMWHKVAANHSDRTRINMFLSYIPSWITGYYNFPPKFVSTLSREQRIILRAYEEKEDLSRPPREDLPLFIDPSAPPIEKGEEPHKVRRLTRYERYFKAH